MSEKKRIVVDMPDELKAEFDASKFRRYAKTDGEGVRAAVKFALECSGAVKERKRSHRRKVS